MTRKSSKGEVIMVDTVIKSQIDTNLISYSTRDIVDVVKRQAKYRKIKITAEMEKKLYEVAEEVLEFRGSQYLDGNRMEPIFQTSSYYWLPEWITQNIIVPEVLACIQDKKPTSDEYKHYLTILEQEKATIGLKDISEDIGDETLLNLMKYNGTVIRYMNNAIKFVPKYLSNQFPYKEDLFVEVLSGTPCVHYSKGEVLSRSIKYILGYMDDTETKKEHNCKCGSKYDKTYEAIIRLSDIVTDLKNKIDNCSQDSKNTEQVLTQEQEEAILKQTIETQQRIKRNDFEKTFEGMISSLYTPVAFSVYELFLKKYGDSIPYIRFKVVPNDQIDTFGTLNHKVYETGENGESSYVYVMNPHRLLEHVVNSTFTYNRSDDMWVLMNKITNRCWTASTLEELLLCYIIDPSTDRDRVIRDIGSTNA